MCTVFSPGPFSISGNIPSFVKAVGDMLYFRIKFPNSPICFRITRLKLKACLRLFTGCVPVGSGSFAMLHTNRISGGFNPGTITLIFYNLH